MIIIHLGKNPSKGGRPPRLNKVNIMIINIVGEVFVFIKSFEWMMFLCINRYMILHVIMM